MADTQEKGTAVVGTDSDELKEFIIDAVRNDSVSVDVSSFNISIDMSNGKHILSDFQDDLLFEYAEDAFVVQNLTSTQQNGMLQSVYKNYTDGETERNRKRAQVKETIDGIISKTEGIADIADISRYCTVTLKYRTMRYTGSSRTQSSTTVVTVTFTNGKKQTLIQGTDYQITYKNNREIGTATMIITGIGNYTGTIEKTFEIVAK